MVRSGPVERIRRELSERRSAGFARHLPAGYQRLGRVVLVRWPEELRPEFGWLAGRLAEELHATAVLRHRGPARGDWRLPDVERLHGASSLTEVLEDGVRFRFDPSRVLYSAGNRAERARLARLPAPDEVVVDLFAGVGYFALPIALHARPRRVVAAEENPESFAYLSENIELNGLSGRVEPRFGDNRRLPLERGAADRVLLGFLPDPLPWVPQALSLLRGQGGWLHLHLLHGARDPGGAASARAGEAVRRAGGTVIEGSERLVKAYGPGRSHWVVDLRAVPPPSLASERVPGTPGGPDSSRTCSAAPP